MHLVVHGDVHADSFRVLVQPRGSIPVIDLTGEEEEEEDKEKEEEDQEEDDEYEEEGEVDEEDDDDDDEVEQQQPQQQQQQQQPQQQHLMDPDLTELSYDVIQSMHTLIFSH